MRCSIAAEIDRDHTVDVVGRVFHERLNIVPAGGIDQYVDARMAPENLGCAASGRGGIGEIDGGELDRQAAGLLDEFSSFFRIDVGTDHPRAAACEFKHRRLADTGCAPGNQGRLAVELHGWAPFLFRRVHR